ncbi:hypothetical protein D0Y50_07155 [Salinimonas sediminis]|uniref:Uncharacterized protein n=1 Tax=Salinimonas sediminis TaxID=2303538 RepID=A0A346NKV6_9ALTE|nr:hypothetical protein D0Y50_07155 [Salinimonas sediminis]
MPGISIKKIFGVYELFACFVNKLSLQPGALPAKHIPASMVDHYVPPPLVLPILFNAAISLQLCRCNYAGTTMPVRLSRY